jgi:para-nitrobenzyl esterase
MDVIVETSAGLTMGERLEDGEIDVFRGIPYAEPPVGHRRWRPPERTRPWVGVRDCRRFGPVALQRLAPANSLFGFEGEAEAEDCLYLNVWTSSRFQRDARPVIVWLHLGAFQFGSGSAPLYQGANWARNGVVFVSLNFRLGRIGFLAHPGLSAESEAGRSGNYGLLDQIAALEWVRDNIARFGGDPSCVTIYGASSGASSISLLMTSPRAKGLFHRAIAESGGSFGPVGRTTGIGDRWQTMEAAEASGQSWAASIGAPRLTDLRRLSGGALRRANARPPIAPDGTFDAARPVIDRQVMCESTHAVFSAGRQAHVPLLVGSAAQEEFAVAKVGLDAETYRQQARREYGDAADMFLGLYPGRGDAEAAASSLRATGHRLFSWQNWAWANLHARRVSDTYYYRFDHAPPLCAAGYHEQATARTLGAFHGASLFYTFNNLHLREWPWSEEDRRLAQTMIRAWVSFAKSGVPVAEGLPSWPGFDPENPTVMALSAKPHLGEVPERLMMVFWDRFYAQSSGG